jgi:diguanylate cyclase (GGDEF)-like protein/PAS domain S-box-containing protein
MVAHDFSDKRYAAVWVDAADPMVFCDEEGLIDCNDAAMRLLGLADASAMLGLPLHHFAPPEQPHGEVTAAYFDRHMTQALSEGRARFECQLSCSDGRLFVVDIQLHRVSLGEGRIVHGVLRDISPRWEAERDLRRLNEAMQVSLHDLTYFDAATGLANQRSFKLQADTRIKQALAGERPAAMICAEPSSLNQLKDSLGHAAVDQVVHAIAKRLSHAVQQNDLVARLGDHVFGILLDGCAENFVSRVAGRLLNALSAPVRVGEHEVSVGGSLGIALLGRDGGDLWTLMQNAEAAMHRASAAGDGLFQFYSAEMNESALARLVLESRLRRALDQDEFALHYQPIVSAASGAIVGCEALIRWNNPELGLTAPTRFIPLAEQSGLIIPIGEWVLATACRQMRVWQQQGIAPLEICVNLSPRQFHDRELLPKLTRILEASGLAPQQLVLELTEGALMEETEETLRTLYALRELGLRLAIDDFGTGYSSLAYLKHFPVNKLKVDRSFVRDIEQSRQGVVIAEAIVNLGRSLRLEVVAEGIETAADVAALRSYGCDLLQGFYYAEPVPAAAMAELLRTGSLRPSQKSGAP